MNLLSFDNNSTPDEALEQFTRLIQKLREANEISVSDRMNEPWKEPTP